MLRQKYLLSGRSITREKDSFTSIGRRERSYGGNDRAVKKQKTREGTLKGCTVFSDTSGHDCEWADVVRMRGEANVLHASSYLEVL
eukprot:5451612-Amphidinium_carterae.1